MPAIVIAQLVLMLHIATKLVSHAAAVVAHQLIVERDGSGLARRAG
jgi:hypothetical protein